MFQSAMQIVKQEFIDNLQTKLTQNEVVGINEKQMWVDPYVQDEKKNLKI